MSSTFKVSDNDSDFARRPEKPKNYICYRTIICHALLYKMRKSSEDDAKMAFNTLFDAINKGKAITNQDFIDFYSVQMEDDKPGYLVVDQSNGSFPLVFYPNENKSPASRTSALSHTIEDIKDNFEIIMPVLSKAGKWSDDIQAELQTKIFNYKED